MLPDPKAPVFIGSQGQQPRNNPTNFDHVFFGNKSYSLLIYAFGVGRSILLELSDGAIIRRQLQIMHTAANMFGPSSQVEQSKKDKKKTKKNH
jgi:hypothetical protein